MPNLRAAAFGPATPLLRQFDEATTGREYGERKSFLEKMKSLFDK